jgi:hypothetical protein
VTRVAALFVLGACSYDPPGNTPDPGSDAAADARPDGAVSDAHLLISEVFVEGSGEFIEIHNPLPTAVDLSTYHLTDSNEYWRLPAAPAAELALLSSDFLVKFPAGTTIAPGAVIVIASEGSAFQSQFGTAPTFTIGAGATTMVEVIQPDQPAMANRLTDTGELVVLFQWDGASDLVRDVDIVVHGMPDTDGNALAAKEPTDGPDAGATPSSYALDALTAAMTDRGPDDDRFSYKRILLEPTHETATGGNGLTGHDETSEALQTTWDLGSMPPTPGVFELP